MTSPTEYSGRGRPERVTSPRASVPERHQTPAEISQIEEIASVLADKLMGQSTTRMRREVRPLKWSLGAVIAAVIAGAGWVTSQASAWQQSQREQWALELERDEQLEEIATHMETPHVTTADVVTIGAQLDAIEQRLTAIEAKLAQQSPPKGKR